MEFWGNSYSFQQLWTPAAISTALLWLDAADASTMTLNGSTVSQWNDKSRNAFHVSQATAANQPTYNATGFNGKPTLDWGADLNNKGLFRSGMTGFNPVQIAGVLKYDGPNPFVTPRVGVMLVDQLQFAVRSNTSGITLSAATQTAFTNGASVASTTVLPAWQSPTLYVAQWTSSGPSSLCYIGTDRFLSNSGWKGQMSECLAFSAVLSTTDRQKLEGYLAWKWGLEANLPGTHPYRYTPPTLDDSPWAGG